MLAGAAGLHVLEEALLDWRGWARATSGVAVTWPAFWVLNGAFLVLAMVAAAVGWRRPVVALALPALTSINAVFAHIGPTVVLGRFSPGTVTALLLYLPIGAAVYLRAWRDGLLTARVLLASTALGAGIMALPVLILALG
jgi:hypothetical protein